MSNLYHLPDNSTTANINSKKKETNMNYLIENVHLGRDLDYRDSNSEGGVTISYTVEVVNMVIGSGIILHTAISVCQHNEPFVRSVGRNIADDRLTNYLKDLAPSIYCATTFIGIGATETNNYTHCIPFDYREDKPFVLSSRWNILGLVAIEAEKIMKNLHPDLA